VSFVSRQQVFQEAFMARFKPLSPDQMTAEQRAVCDDLMKSRGSVRGPFPVMLHNPGLAAAAEKLGGYARFGSKIEPRLLEFAVAVIARFWGAQVEWVSHSRLAREAGLDPAILKAVEEGKHPEFINDDEKAVYDFLTSLLNTTRVDDETYARCLETLGERGMIDLVAANTHYTVVSMTLNAFHVPAPEGAETPPFGPGR
jgi:4-carboxymuconolactone decarboxylase